MITSSCSVLLSDDISSVLPELREFLVRVSQRVCTGLNSIEKLWKELEGFFSQHRFVIFVCFCAKALLGIQATLQGQLAPTYDLLFTGFKRSVASRSTLTLLMT
jgi:hypothetical protein